MDVKREEEQEAEAVVSFTPERERDMYLPRNVLIRENTSQHFSTRTSTQSRHTLSPPVVVVLLHCAPASPPHGPRLWHAISYFLNKVLINEHRIS